MYKHPGTIFLLVLILISSACQQTTLETQPPAALTNTIQTAAATSTTQATSTVTTPLEPTATPEPAELELGEPFWIGRGKVRAAEFLPGAQQIAVAWGSGVSLQQVEDGEEVWFQRVPSNLLAFGVQPQGEYLAAALSDGSLVIFTAASGEMQQFAGAKPNAYWGDLAWSPDGKTVAFQFIGANRGDPIYLLDIAGGQLSQVPGSQTGEGVMPELVWSPDGSAITVAALGHECSRFVDVLSGELVMRLGESGQCYPSSPLLFLPDGQTLAAQGQAGGLDLLRYPDGVQIGTLSGAPGGIIGRLVEFPATGVSLFVDPAGQWIASRGGYEPCYCGNPEDQPYHALIVWGLASGAVVTNQERAIDPLANRHRLAAAFDGEDILVFFDSGEITRWTFNDPQASDVVQSHIPVRPIKAFSLRWSQDGSHLAYTGDYGGVEIYTTKPPQLVWHFDAPLEAPALSPNGELVALYDPEQAAELVYNVESGELLHNLPASPTILGASFSLDGEYLAYGGNSGVRVVELESGEVTDLDTSGLPRVDAYTALSRVIWSPDGQALVAELAERNPDIEEPGLVVLWQRRADGSFEMVYQVENYRANYEMPRLTLAAFNPSGSRVALDAVFQLDVYDLLAGRVINSFREYVLGAWVNDDELLAAEAQYDVRLAHIQVVTGEITTGSGRDLGDNVYAVGGLYTAQMADPPVRGITVRYWKSNAIVVLGEHTSLNLVDLSWSPDGGWLASMGDDGTLLVWPVVMP